MMERTVRSWRLPNFDAEAGRALPPNGGAE